MDLGYKYCFTGLSGCDWGLDNRFDDWCVQDLVDVCVIDRIGILA